jgi:hypothetical protein
MQSSIHCKRTLKPSGASANTMDGASAIPPRASDASGARERWTHQLALRSSLDSFELGPYPLKQNSGRHRARN